MCFRKKITPCLDIFSGLVLSHNCHLHTRFDITQLWLYVSYLDFRKAQKSRPNSAVESDNSLLVTIAHAFICIANVKHPRKGHYFFSSGGSLKTFPNWLFVSWCRLEQRAILLGPDRLAAFVPDPLLSIQEQSPDAFLPPTTLPCLFTHQPPVVSVRVYVYHNYRALQPPPWRLCSPAPLLPSMLPILTWHDFLSPPSCLLGLRGTGSLTVYLPLPSLQPPLPSLSHDHSLRSLHCHLPPCSFACCWPSCKVYFTPSLFVCDYLP